MSLKKVQWEPSCSTRTNGHTYMTKLIVAFRHFANAPKHFSAPPTRQNVTQTTKRKREPVLRSTPALNRLPLCCPDKTQQM